MSEIPFDNPYLMENQEQYLTDEERRMLECCNQAVLDMIAECALHDQLVVKADANDNPIWVRAREVLEKNPGLKLADVTYTPVEVDIKNIIQNRNR